MRLNKPVKRHLASRARSLFACRRASGPRLSRKPSAARCHKFLILRRSRLKARRLRLQIKRLKGCRNARISFRPSVNDFARDRVDHVSTHHNAALIAARWRHSQPHRFGNRKPARNSRRQVIAPLRLQPCQRLIVLCRLRLPILALFSPRKQWLRRRGTGQRKQDRANVIHPAGPRLILASQQPHKPALIFLGHLPHIKQSCHWRRSLCAFRHHIATAPAALAPCFPSARPLVLINPQADLILQFRRHLFVASQPQALHRGFKRCSDNLISAHRRCPIAQLCL